VTLEPSWVSVQRIAESTTPDRLRVSLKLFRCPASPQPSQNSTAGFPVSDTVWQHIDNSLPLNDSLFNDSISDAHRLSGKNQTGFYANYHLAASLMCFFAKRMTKLIKIANI